MAAIARKFMAHYINSAITGAEVFVRLGDDLEEYNVEMSASVNTSKNILGQTRTKIDSYEISASVEPYYCSEGDPLFERLQDIVDERKTLDDLRTSTVEVHLWEESGSGVYKAFKQDAIIEVTSYGGDTTGYQIPFTVHYVGDRIPGTFNIETKAFTANVTV